MNDLNEELKPYFSPWYQVGTAEPFRKSMAKLLSTCDGEQIGKLIKVVNDYINSTIKIEFLFFCKGAELAMEELERYCRKNKIEKFAPNEFIAFIGTLPID